MKFIIPCFLALCYSVSKVHSDETCFTPNDEKANCTPIESCPTLRNAAKLFAKHSICGKNLVCCGNHPDFTSTDKITRKSSNLLPDEAICGSDLENEKIIGGQITLMDEFPWVSALEYKNKTSGESVGIRCVGSVINYRYVLTSAACLLPRELELTTVWLGDWRLSTDPDCQTFVEIQECADPVHKFNIEKIIPHAQFSVQTTSNNIGLIRLSENITYTDFIRPVCLPKQPMAELKPSTVLTVSSWGTIENGTSSDYKLKIAVPLLENEMCNADLQEPINLNHLCAGEVDKNICHRDSGAPLMRLQTNNAERNRVNWVLEGLASFGSKCGNEGFPGVYTRVARHMNWILDNIEE